MELSESLENYIEAIFLIAKKKGAARAKDIAQMMSVNNSSVTEALRSLSKKGLVNYAPYDLITLTDEGTELAKVIVERHQSLEAFLTKVLGVDAEEADAVACKMEHVVTDDIVSRISELTDYISKEQPEWRD